MQDLISRQAAIDAIENTDWYHQNANRDMVSGANPDKHQAWYKADDVYSALESLPSAQPEQRWIPCSERLPESDVDVLTQYSDYSMSVDFRTASSSRWFWADGEDLPIAWMPLPEPYREERTEE